jgi:hypothetical protein
MEQIPGFPRETVNLLARILKNINLDPQSSNGQLEASEALRYRPVSSAMILKYVSIPQY